MSSLAKSFETRNAGSANKEDPAVNSTMVELFKQQKSSPNIAEKPKVEAPKKNKEKFLRVIEEIK